LELRLQTECSMPFERKPIQPEPTCAICGKPIKNHNSEEMKTCMEERRRRNLQD